MNKPMIEIGSVTFAMKGRNLLAEHGIEAKVERVSRSAQGSGCSFGVYVPIHTNEAEQILRRGGVPIVGRSDRRVQL